MAAEAKRLQWLDILKFFGIALVVFGHIYQNEAVVDWLYSFHVPLFFIAGGALYRPRRISDDIRRRAFRILVPYLFFGVVILLYYYFVERPFRDVDIGLAEGFIGLLIGNIEHLEFHSHLWFLPCYFVTCVVYNILYKLLKPLGCGIVCAAASLCYVLLPIPPLPWGIDRMCGYLGLFALANVTMEKQIFAKAEKLHTAVKLAAAAVLIGAGAVFSFMGLDTGLMWIVCAVIGAAGVMALSMSVGRAELLARVGSMTLVILCIHGPAYRIIVKLASMLTDLSADAIRSNIFAALAITAVTLAACCLAYLVLAKLAPVCIGIMPKKKAETAE